MKKLFLIFMLIAGEALAFTPELDHELLSSLPRYSITMPAEQSYCYRKGSELQGYQSQKLQRIASITKILTTYFASELTDLHQRFETRIYIAGDRMHIAGGNDPYWEEDKILLLMQALNNQGYKTFKSVTFDDRFFFADVGLDSHADITPAFVRTRLSAVWGAKNSGHVKALWNSVKKFASEEGVTLDTSFVPTLRAKAISFSASNPLANEGPTVYVHRSLPFHRILKSMNVMSKNHVAQNIFRTLSKQQSFDSFMNERGFASSAFKIYNGSGLPVEKGTRLDNLTTCELILDVSMKLRESITKHNLELSDILAVNGGKDLGSFRNRFLQYPETHQAVLSKTGTLKHTSTLAGFLMMDELVPFAILNHTYNTTSAKSFQDFFVSRMFTMLGQPEPLIYQKISIFPWNESDFLEQSFSDNLALN